MIFCFQNCSDLLREKNVPVTEKTFFIIESEGQELAKLLQSLEQFIQREKGQISQVHNELK